MRRDPHDIAGPEVVDDRTFDLLQALTSSLETLDVIRVEGLSEVEGVVGAAPIEERGAAQRAQEAG